MIDDDDYWNTSETSARAFSFDDDVLSPREILAIGQQSPLAPGDVENVIGSVAKAPLLPLSSLISPKSLELLVLAQSGSEAKGGVRSVDDSVSVTLRRLVLKRRCSLHAHRTLAAKTQLLDGAMALGDGDALLAVILYLIQSLQRRLVYALLSSRPLALDHYISFLVSEAKISDLTDLLTMLGRSPDAAIYNYEHVVKSSGNNVEVLLGKLRNVMANHFSQSGVDPHCANMIACHIKFLEWQACANIPELKDSSVLQCVAHCCARHWHDGAGKMMSPLTLCQQQAISPQQYDWVALNVHATLKNWDIVESLFTRKNWLGRSSVSSGVPVPLLVSRLSELGAPSALLAAYVAHAGSAEQRLELAKRYKVHSVVIETLAKARDRAALTNYKMALRPHSEEYFLAENALQDPVIKWKN